MAKSLSSNQLAALVQADKRISRLTKLQVFVLAQSGMINVEDAEFVVTSKGSRALKRNTRKARIAEVKGSVQEVALGLLSEDGSMTKHRSIWEGVGRQEHTRDEVLEAMRELRDEGILDCIKLSNNNFQIAWVRGDKAPAVEAAPEFETNALEVVAAAK